LEQDKPDLKAAAEARRKAKSDAIQKGVADFNRLLELLVRIYFILKIFIEERLRGVNDQLVFAKHEQKKKKLDVAALGDRVEELNEAFNMAKEELDEQRIGVEQATRKANECRLRLMTVAKIGSTYRENLSGEQHMVLKMLKMEWSSNSIPNDIEKVREEITEETARMNIAPADGCRSVSFRLSFFVDDDDVSSSVCQLKRRRNHVEGFGTTRQTINRAEQVERPAPIDAEGAARFGSQNQMAVCGSRHGLPAATGDPLGLVASVYVLASGY
uniref:DUF3395 domain-containing protein n=1 Tax=Toxocara canis TaxID=6265 RepID=A0A183VA09_TOXCA